VIKKIKFKDLQWTAVARYKCFLCGAFKRKKPCSPFAREVSFYRQKLSLYKIIYIIICETDGSIPWRFGLDKSKLVKKIDRGLKGVAKGMPLQLHKNLLKFKKRHSCFILISGSCSLCRPCNVSGKCLKGGFAHSPEGVGIDVMGTLKKMGYNIEDVPYNKVVNVGMVFMNKEK